MTAQDAPLPVAETSEGLSSLAGVRHGFFGRAGGVSTGAYASLNAGPGSSDDRAAVAENRRRCAAALGVSPENLLTLHQRHTAKVVVTTGPWGAKGPPEADGVVTRTRGLAVGALAADCMPFLFADVDAGVVAAAHAGWRGALAGVLENTVAAMVAIGASPERIRASVGPCLRPPDFEVGLELPDKFEAAHPGAARFFAPDAHSEKRQFDLVGFGIWRLASVGVETVEVVGASTLGSPDRYFSCRWSAKTGAPDYGRNLSAIVLEPPAPEDR